MLSPLIVFAANSKIEGLIRSTANLIGTVTVVVFMLAILVFAWGIVKLIASAGSPEKIKQAKGIIWWGLIGMFVLASIAGIISFFRSELGIESIQTIPAPQFTPK